MTPLSATPRHAALGLCALLVASVPAVPAAAHFVLVSPDASHAQNFLGDPQKQPPCGDTPGTTATGKVTTFEPGQTISIKINETIFHPGHYRVALAKTRAELPSPPPVTAGLTPCGSAPIDPSPTFPVLVDGALKHSAPFFGEQTIEVTLPTDLTCDECVLQVIEFMSDHGLNDPGGCYYHHCAHIALTAASGAGDAGTKPDAGSGSGSDAGSAKPDAGTKRDAGARTDGDGDDDAADDAVDDDDAPAPQTSASSGCEAGEGGDETTLWLYGIALMIGLIARGRSRARRP